MKRNTQIEEELFPFYALDALTAEERAEVDAYVAINPEARERLAELMEGAAQLGIGVEPIAPPPAVKQQLMQRVQESLAAGPLAGHASTETTNALASQSERRPREGRPRQTRPRFRPLTLFAATAGAALALLAIVSAFLLRSQVNDLQAELHALQTETAALQSQLDNLEQENASLQRRLLEQEEILATYREPGAFTVAIGDATGDNPAALGTLTHQPGSDSAVLLASNLRPLDDASVYQLWLIHDETPVSAGTFTVDESGSGSLIASVVQPGFNAVGVSIEPQGGSEQPTPGNIVLLGRLS